MSYAWEKFHGAMHALAGRGSQKERLVSAFVDNISNVVPEEIPKERREEFSRFIEDMTRVEPWENEGTVEATVNRMDERQVERMIEYIFNIHDTITRHQEPLR